MTTLNAGLRICLLLLTASICSQAYAQLLTDPDATPDPESTIPGGFGASVAIAGRTAWVSAPYAANGPLVHVFVKQRDGTWTPRQRISAPSAAAGGFGASIVFDGFSALIWASEQNAVYEYVYHRGTWRVAQVIKAPAHSRGFGGSLALQGCDAFIRNVGAVGSAQALGAILVYNRCRHWRLEQTLLANDLEPGSGFGSSIDVSWNEMMIGATGPGHSVYHYVRHGGRWVRKQRLLTADATATGSFGASVAFDRNFLVVGDPAFGYLNQGSYKWGAAHVFRRMRGQWIEEDRLQPDTGYDWAAFGSLIKLSHGSLLITAPDPATQNNNLEGALFIYQESHHGFEFSLETDAGGGGGSFGASLATFGRQFIVGAPFERLRRQYLYEGAAYIGELPPRHDGNAAADRDSDDDSED